MEQFYGSSLTLPFWDRLRQAQSILIVGCSGGYDFLHGFPLYFALKSQGKQVHLANISATDRKTSTIETLLRATNIAQTLILSKVTSNSEATEAGTRDDEYFPEKRACEWFRDKTGEDVPMYLFMRCGVGNMKLGYELLSERLGLDLIIAISAGCEALMAGDEHEIGRPNAMINLFSISRSRIPAVLVCIAATADTYYGVSDASVMRAIAELTEQGGFLGTFSLDRNAAEVRGYLEASDYVVSRCLKYPSIYHYFVLHSLHGKFGNYNFHPKTQGSQLFINPVMNQYFTFDLSAVIQRVKYSDLVEDTRTAAEFLEALDYYRSQNTILPREDWPNLKAL